MRIRQRKLLIFSVIWISISLRTSSALATSIAISGGARTGNGNMIGTSTSSLRASDIDHIANNESASSGSTEKRKKTAVIVGGGPGGLAAALVLSNVKKPGNTNDEEEAFFERIIVLDEASEIKYDPSRSYFFNINRRGQRFTDAFNIDLTKCGTPATEFALQRVPSDPKDVFDGTSPSVQLMTDKEKENIGTMYWIPRHALIELMTNEILSKNNEKNNGNPVIEFRRGVCCEYIEPAIDDLIRIATAKNGANEKEDSIFADLCVGADGISSKVRQSLKEGRFNPEKWSNAKNASKNFRLKKYTSPATGLRAKGLRLDSKLTIPKGGTEADSKSEIPIDTRYSYSLQSTVTGPTDGLKLAIFPQNDPDSTSGRPVNTVTLPCHDIWDPEKIRTDDGGRSVKAYFKKIHPRFDWDNIVEEEEWERFASSKGSTFPPCQYSPSMYVSSRPSHKDSDAIDAKEFDGTGVVLVGDALHSFPPDLGQGVNTAMCDALVLRKSFKDAAASSRSEADASKAPITFVSKALKSYQEKNGRETRALIALARCGAPFQYRQATKIMKFRKVLWTTNILLRIILNKITIGLSPKPAVMLMMVRPRSPQSENHFVCCWPPTPKFRISKTNPPIVAFSKFVSGSQHEFSSNYEKGQHSDGVLVVFCSRRLFVVNASKIHDLIQIVFATQCS